MYALRLQKVLDHPVQGFLHVSDLLDAVRLEGAHKLAAALSSVEDFPRTRAVSTRTSGMPDFVPDEDWAEDLEYCSAMWAAEVLAWHGAASAVACGVKLDDDPRPSECDCRPLKPWGEGGEYQIHGFPCHGKWVGKPWPGLADIIVTLVMHVTSAC